MARQPVRHPTRIVSPREPSGVTWLVNCLLELGLKTWRESVPPMWRPLGGDRWELTPEQELLRKWLPALEERRVFSFSPARGARWTHEWPDEAPGDGPILLFLRDPRDAHYSRWRREAPQLGWREFNRLLDPRTLLDRIDAWRLFVASWLEQPGVVVLRFEQAKLDPAGVLGRVCELLGLERDPVRLARALSSSTSERAQQAERAYRARAGDTGPPVNQGGHVERWRSLEGDERRVAEEIAARCGDLLPRIGYEAAGAQPLPLGIPGLSDHLRRLPGGPELERASPGAIRLLGGPSPSGHDQLAARVLQDGLEPGASATCGLGEGERVLLQENARAYLGAWAVEGQRSTSAPSPPRRWARALAAACVPSRFGPGTERPEEWPELDETEFLPLTRCPSCGDLGQPLSGSPSLVAGRRFPAGGWRFGAALRRARGLRRCRVCALIWQRLVPRPALVERLYPADTGRPWTPDPTRETWPRALQVLPPSPGRLLEVGANDGHFLGLLPAGWERAALEPAGSPLALREARAELYVGRLDQPDLELPAGYFDVVCMFDVVEHLLDPRLAFARLATLLRPGGRLILETGDTSSAPARLLGAGWWYYDYIEHTLFWSRAALDHALRREGLVLEDCRRVVHSGRRRLPRMARELIAAIVRAGLLGAAGGAQSAGTWLDHPLRVQWPDHLFVVARRE